MGLHTMTDDLDDDALYYMIENILPRLGIEALNNLCADIKVCIREKKQEAIATRKRNHERRVRRRHKRLCLEKGKGDSEGTVSDDESIADDCHIDEDSDQSDDEDSADEKDTEHAIKTND